MLKRSILAIIMIVSIANCSTVTESTWIKKSDKVAEDFTKEFATLYPEIGSSLG